MMLVQMLSSPTLAIRFAALPCGFLIRSEMMFVSSMWRGSQHLLRRRHGIVDLGLRGYGYGVTGTGYGGYGVTGLRLRGHDTHYPISSRRFVSGLGPGFPRCKLRASLRNCCNGYHVPVIA